MQALPAAASAADEAGDAYREQARSAIHEVLARREFADLHADPYALLANDPAIGSTAYSDESAAS